MRILDKKNARWDRFTYFKLCPKEKLHFEKSKCFTSTCQLQSVLFYNWVNFSLQKTFKKGFISQWIKHSVLYSKWIFFLFWKAKLTFFLFGVTWNFFFFLDSSKIDYIHAIPEKIAAFFSHAIKFAIKTKQRNNSSGLEKYSWNTGNQKKNHANCS